MEFILDILIDGLTGSLKGVAQIAIIVIPLMIVMELLKEFSVLDKIYFLFNPLLKLFKLPKEAAMPLMAGLVFGISYGAGLIMQAAREGNLSVRDLLIINIFLGLCHSLIEDTLLFVVIGASLIHLVVFRVVLALLVTFIFVKYYEKPRELSPRSLSENLFND